MRERKKAFYKYNKDPHVLSEIEKKMSYTKRTQVTQTQIKGKDSIAFSLLMKILMPV